MFKILDITVSLLYNILNDAREEAGILTIGEIIREYRKEHGLSQRQFASLCGDVSNGYISMIERGKNPVNGKPIILSVEKVAMFAHAMGMSMNQLVAMADDMPIDIGDSSADKLHSLGEQMTAPSRSKEWRMLSEGLAEFEKRNSAAFRATFDFLTTTYPEIFTERTDADDAEP